MMSSIGRVALPVGVRSCLTVHFAVGCTALPVGRKVFISTQILISVRCVMFTMKGILLSTNSATKVVSRRGRCVGESHWKKSRNIHREAGIVIFTSTGSCVCRREGPFLFTDNELRIVDEQQRPLVRSTSEKCLAACHARIELLPLFDAIRDGVLTESVGIQRLQMINGESEKERI